MNAKVFWYLLGSINAFCAGNLIGHTVKFGFGLETCSALAALVVMRISVHEINKFNQGISR